MKIRKWSASILGIHSSGWFKLVIQMCLLNTLETLLKVEQSSFCYDWIEWLGYFCSCVILINFPPANFRDQASNLAAWPAEDIRWIAQEVASILKDTPCYNLLTSTSTTGGATSDKLSLCLLLDITQLYNLWFHLGEALRCTVTIPTWTFLLNFLSQHITTPSDMYVRVYRFAFFKIVCPLPLPCLLGCHLFKCFGTMK